MLSYGGAGNTGGQVVLGKPDRQRFMDGKEEEEEEEEDKT